MSTVKRFLWSFLFPLVSWIVYWNLGRTDHNYSGTEFLIVTISAFAVGCLVFALSGLIAELEIRSKVGFLCVCVWIACLGLGVAQIAHLIHDVGSWGLPLAQYCVWVPFIYIGCKQSKYPEYGRGRRKLVYTDREGETKSVTF